MLPHEGMRGDERLAAHDGRLSWAHHLWIKLTCALSAQLCDGFVVTFLLPSSSTLSSWPHRLLTGNALIFKLCCAQVIISHRIMERCPRHHQAAGGL